MTVLTTTDRPKLVRNRCVIEVFGVDFVLSRSFLDLTVVVGVFVIGLSASMYNDKEILIHMISDITSMKTFSSFDTCIK